MFSIAAFLLGNFSGDTLFDEAQMELSGIEGIELEELSNGSYRLDGEIYKKSDFQRIQNFMKEHPNVENRARMNPAISKNSTSSKDHRSSLLLEVFVLEIKTSLLDRMGMRLGSPLDASGTFDFRFFDQSSKTFQVRSGDPIRGFLDLALQSGEARIHIKQSLVAQNGKQAEFHAGGEFPLQMRSAHSAKIEYKPYGFSLRFLPELVGKDSVHLKMECEISDVDLGSQIDGLPMLLKKNLKTQVLARLNETLALAGIQRAVESRYADQVPGLSRIPMMGGLFRSDDFKNQRSEAYLFVYAKKLEEPWLPRPKI